MTSNNSTPFFLSKESLGVDLDQTFGTLEKNITADIAVVGAGITGVLISYFLAEAGIKTVLLEGQIIGKAATGRNTGFILTGTVEHYSRVKELLGKEKAKRLWNLTQENHEVLFDIISNEKIACEYRKNGSLILGVSEQEGKELKATYTELVSDGFHVDYLDEVACREHLNSNQFNGAIRMRNDGEIQPVKFVRDLANILKNNGMPVFEKTMVNHISTDETSDSVQIETDKGTVSCAMAILATNAYSAKLQSRLKDKIVPVKGQGFVTDPFSEKLFEEVIYANFGYEYWRQLQDGRFMVGGFRENAQNSEENDSENVDLELLQGLYDYFTSLFPQAKSVNISHAWAGTMGFSQDGLPLLGAVPGSSNVFVCGGYTGHGLGFAGSLGKMAAEMMIEGKTPNSDLFYTQRFAA